MIKKQTDKHLIDNLVETALDLGVSGAKAVPAADIPVKDSLAELCKDPGCENYGLSPSCPPHVSGPDGFRDTLKSFEFALVIKLDVPSDILFSEERREVFQLLHQIASDLENAARDMGYHHARAFAGGSCKNIFCHHKPDCRVLNQKETCRNPDIARPSMSGFGIDVSEMMKRAGLTMNMAVENGDKGKTSMGTVTGLVLIG